MDTTKIDGGGTLFLWDVEDCSILDNLNPKLVEQNIKSYLEDKGYINVYSSFSITGFIDDNTPEKFINVYRSARIHFCPVPKGNKYLREHYMSVEILIWASCEFIRKSNLSNLCILSENIKEKKQVASVLEALKEKDNYNVFYIEPGTLLGKCGGTPFDRSQSELVYCGYCNKPCSIKEMQRTRGGRGGRGGRRGGCVGRD